MHFSSAKKSQKFFSIVLGFVLAMVYANQAQAVSFSVCKSDFEALCKGMEFNEANVTKCFVSKRAKLTGKCKGYFDGVVAAKNPFKGKEEDTAKPGKVDAAKSKAEDAKSKTAAKKKEANDKVDGLLNKLDTK